MLRDGAFLRRLPNITDPAQSVQIEALVFSADAADASLRAIHRIAFEHREKICNADKYARSEIFIHAWTIVDCVHTAIQILRGLEYATPLAVSFIETYGHARLLRNKMDHLPSNAKNAASMKGAPPIYGSITYICIPDANLVINNSGATYNGGGIVAITAGRFNGPKHIKLPLPSPGMKTSPVFDFRLTAFDETLDIQAAVQDLLALIDEVDRRFEEKMTQQAEELSLKHGIAKEQLLGNSLGGLCAFMAFQANEGDPDEISVRSIDGSAE